MKKPSVFIISDLISQELWGKYFTLATQIYDSDYIVCDMRQAQTIVALGLGKKTILTLNLNFEYLQGIDNIKQNLFPMFHLVLNINGVTAANFLNVSATPIVGDYEFFKLAKAEPTLRKKVTQEAFLKRKYDYYVKENFDILHRTKMLEIITATGKTLSHGTLPKTVKPTPVDEKTTPYSRVDSRFGVVIEDAFYNEYISSGIVSAYARGMIPVYVGYHKSSEYLESVGLNPKAIVPITQPPVKTEELQKYLDTVAPFFSQFINQKPGVYSNVFNVPLITEKFDAHLDNKFKQIIDSL